MVRGRKDYHRGVSEKGEETRVFTQSGSVAKNATVTLCDLPNQDVELQHLEFSTEVNTSELLIMPYKKDGSLDVHWRGLDRDGDVLARLSPLDINTEESIVWYELAYDTTNNRFKFGLGYPVRFANGVRIQVYNSDDLNAQKIGCEAIVLIRG